MVDVIGRAKVIVESEVDPTSIHNAGTSVGNLLGGALRKSAVVAGAGIATVLGAAVTKGFQRLSAIEEAEAKLRGLGNSGKNVSLIMKNALDAVKGTAFGLGDAASIAASAVASGVKPGQELERTLRLVGDAATIGGTSLAEMGAIFNKVSATGKAQGEVLNQLGERGIPIIQLLAKSLGVSTEQVLRLSEQGKISFADFQKAIEDGMGGAALKSGETFKGALANAGAALGRFGAALLGPSFASAPALFQAITEKLDAMTPAAEKAGKAISAFLESFKKPEPVGTGTVLAPGAKPEKGDVGFLRTALDANAEEAGRTTWQKFLASWKANSEEEGDQIWHFLTVSFPEANARMAEGWEAMIQMLKDGWNGFTGFFADKWDTITSGVKKFGSDIRKAWAEDVANLKEKWAGFTEWLSGSLSKIGDVFKGAWDGIKAAGIAAFDKLKAAINSVIGGINKAIDLIQSVPGVPNVVGHVPLLRAEGGPASGWTVAGERGPELIQLPAGSYVHNNNDTKEMLSGGGDVTINISTTGVTSDLLQELNWWGKFGPLGVASG